MHRKVHLAILWSMHTHRRFTCECSPLCERRCPSRPLLALFGHVASHSRCPILRSSPWIRGAPHGELAMLISRISLRISGATVGRPPRRRDFHRQYELNPARCHSITVSGFTIAKAPSTFGAKRYKPANIRRSNIPNVGRFDDFRWQHVKLMTQNHVFQPQARPATGTLRPTPTRLGYKPLA